MVLESPDGDSRSTVKGDRQPTHTRRPGGRPSRTLPEPLPPPARARERFLKADRERAEREWMRYEGTAQRDLFRELRERFLARHALDGRWALDIGSGPGRFSPFLGGRSSRRVALDLSRAMLELARERAAEPKPEIPLDPVQGDAIRAPFATRRFAEVAVVGNALGFEASAGPELLAAVEALVAPGGVLVLEVAPGPGERCRYLGRLPPGVVRRLLAAPPAAVLRRLRPEGFSPEPPRHAPTSFRRWSAEELTHRWTSAGWTLREVMAVAPALGLDSERLAEVARDPKAWSRLRELEELLGRESSRWPSAAAVLLAVQRSTDQAPPALEGGTPVTGAATQPTAPEK
jgi:SAM-dependent methyltransferase